MKILASAPLVEQNTKNPIDHRKWINRIGSIFEEVIVSTVFLLGLIFFFFVDFGKFI